MGRDRTEVKEKSIRNAIWWLIPIIFLGLFYFFPLGSILTYSFKQLPEADLAPFVETVISPSTWRILWFTFWQAAVSTLLTLMIGLPGAYLFGRYDFPGKRVIQALTAVPFVMPTLVIAASFNALLGPQGAINLALKNLFDLAEPPIEFMYSISAILTAHVFYNTSIILRSVSSFWANIDPQLDEAAQTLGANRWQIFSKVTFPILSPAIAAAALLVFIFDFTSFGVILVLGGARFATIEVAIFTQALNFLNLPHAASLSLIQLICTISLMSIYQFLSKRISKPLTIRNSSPILLRFSSWKSRLMGFSIILVLVTLLLTPLAALALRSITQTDLIDNDRKEFSLIYYKELTKNNRLSLFYASPATSIQLSLGYAALTVLISIGLGLPAAWVITRNNKNLPAQLLDTTLMLPIATSSVTLGLGFIIALRYPPLDLRTSPLLIPLAHSLIATPFVVRSLVPAILRIQPQIHQAASVLGATPTQILLRIDTPIIARSLLVAATFAFTISLGEFGATALISRPEYPTITIAIYRFLGQPGPLNYGQAIAMSTILMIVCAAGMLIIEKIRLPNSDVF